MESFFNPRSMAIFGISEKKKSIPGYILDNTQRWGFEGKIYGIMPGCGGETVEGVDVFDSVHDLPEVPDLAVMLIPAKFVPMAMRECGKFGIRRVAVLAGGFNESGDSGETLAAELLEAAEEYDIRFLGPNGLTVADAVSGVCLPFIPHIKMEKGGFSFISQSGGFFLVLWNLMRDENIGMARFASIGNKLNVDETDVLEYFGRDPETKVIGLYLESIANGERLVEVASKINKPIIALKANRSEAGGRAAMSHTASMSNNDSIVDAAFERAGIIRVEHVHDLIAAVRAFKLPPMRGNRLMVMTPGGGSAVMMADLAEKYGFEFADPGARFYEGLNQYTNAGGIIKFSNPLDMGDIYDIDAYPKIIGEALASDAVDGAVYGHARPLFPEDDDSIFKKMFHTDISEETISFMEAADKPLGVSMSAPGEVMGTMKRKLPYPIFNRAEDTIAALRIQADYYAREALSSQGDDAPGDFDFSETGLYLEGCSGNIGEETLEALSRGGIAVAPSIVAPDEPEALKAAETLGFPLVMKVDSPDVLHKSDAGGVVVDVKNGEEVRAAFRAITENVKAYRSGARINGIRLAQMAPAGHDMFVGAMRDKSFGPVVVFGYGGIYTEVFKDIETVLCPAPEKEIREKLARLTSYPILEGARGKNPADINALVKIIAKVSHLMRAFPAIEELDLNPVRVFDEGEGATALDGRMKLAAPLSSFLPDNSEETQSKVQPAGC